MKTPDEFKKNLIACMDEAIEVRENGDAHDLLDFAHHAHARMSETLTYIQQLEAELEAIKRERDAAVVSLEKAAASGKVCIGCIHMDCEIGEMCQQNDFDCWNCRPGCVCKGCVNNSLWQWRGVCPENTEVQDNA